MNAEVLRRAAALMRERAESASVWQMSMGDPQPLGWHAVDELDWALDLDHRVHIASWHPAVALAVALLLENEANAWESQDAHVSDWPDLSVNPARRELLTSIATTYLGDPS